MLTYSFIIVLFYNLVITPHIWSPQRTFHVSNHINLLLFILKKFSHNYPNYITYNMHPKHYINTMIARKCYTDLRLQHIRVKMCVLQYNRSLFSVSLANTKVLWRSTYGGARTTLCVWRVLGECIVQSQHADVTYDRSQCPNTYSYLESNPQKHIDVVHSTGRIIQHLCHHCVKIFKWESGLLQHLKRIDA